MRAMSYAESGIIGSWHGSGRFFANGEGVKGVGLDCGTISKPASKNMVFTWQALSGRPERPSSYQPGQTNLPGVKPGRPDELGQADRSNGETKWYW